MSKPKIAAAMSGGLDSSVAAALLIEQGYEVIGVTMRLWPSEAADDAARSAGEVARRLGIPHHVLDLTGQFRRHVVDDFIEQYAHGRTPNPCVKCNAVIKFGALAEFARAKLGCERVATGHYARVVYDSASQTWKLLRGADRSKDQSYFLYRLDQAQLSKVLLPVGGQTKKESAVVARRMGIRAVARPESQDVCFIPHGRCADFLAREAPELMKPGDLLDTDGNVIGSHRGIAFYTVGQRRGLGYAAGTRLYVVKIDPEANTVTIGPEKMLMQRSVQLRNVVFIAGHAPGESVVVSAKIRYNTQGSPAILRAKKGGKAELIFDQSRKAVTPGQSAVFYLGEEVLGGGVIE